MIRTAKRRWANLPPWAQVLACTVVLLALFVGTAQATGTGIVDDAYIFLRYARNACEGRGLVFNAGERVEGFSSPAWMAAILGLAFVTGVSAPGIVALSMITGAVTIVLIAGRSSRNDPGPCLGALVLATHPVFAYWSGSGMDSVLFGLTMAGLALTAARDIPSERRLTGCGIWLAATCAARPEGLWSAPVLLLWTWWADTSRPRARALAQLFLPSAVVIALLLMARYAYYGAWWPNTYYAKVGIPLAVRLPSGARYLSQGAAAFAPLVAAAVVAWGKLEAGERRALYPLWAFAAWWFFYPLPVGGDHFALFRFLLPFLVIMAVLASRILSGLLRRGHGAHVAAAAGAIVVANLLAFVHPQRLNAAGEVQLARTWSRVGQWCSSLEAGSIVTLVVGAIPFYCDKPTIDPVGLVDAHIARQGHIHEAAVPGHQKYDTAYVLGRSPRYIIFPSVSVAPQFEDVASRREPPDQWWFAFNTLVTDSETLRLYTYRNARLPDGGWVEYLERK